MRADGALVCPSCGDDSSIAKVSGVHQALPTGPAAPELARLLAPPMADVLGMDNIEFWIGLGGAIGAFIGFMCGRIAYLWAGIDWLLSMLVPSAIGWVAGAVIACILKARLRQRRRPEYLRKLDRWERAYYCEKHNLVFIPGDDWSGSPTDFRGLMS